MSLYEVERVGKEEARKKAEKRRDEVLIRVITSDATSIDEAKQDEVWLAKTVWGEPSVGSMIGDVILKVMYVSS
ncbi:hypothetical protein L4C33_13160 [Vibrio makurazakiensis]|uniref:hypothetical protein n=1 Tax=Vibrio makurazakiensis TaxID=2910250 RepID=UPI003D12E933